MNPLEILSNYFENQTLVIVKNGQVKFNRFLESDCELNLLKIERNSLASKRAKRRLRGKIRQRKSVVIQQVTSSNGIDYFTTQEEMIVSLPSFNKQHRIDGANTQDTIDIFYLNALNQNQ